MNRRKLLVAVMNRRKLLGCAALAPIAPAAAAAAPDALPVLTERDALNRCKDALCDFHAVEFIDADTGEQRIAFGSIKSDRVHYSLVGAHDSAAFDRAFVEA